MADTTHAALRAHMERWRTQNRKRGMETNQLGEHDECIRWLCERIDAMPKWAEFKLKRTLRTPKNGCAVRLDGGKR